MHRPATDGGTGARATRREQDARSSIRETSDENANERARRRREPRLDPAALLMPDRAADLLDGARLVEERLEAVGYRWSGHLAVFGTRTIESTIVRSEPDVSGKTAPKRERAVRPGRLSLRWSATPKTEQQVRRRYPSARLSPRSSSANQQASPTRKNHPVPARMRESLSRRWVADRPRDHASPRLRSCAVDVLVAFLAAVSTVAAVGALVFAWLTVREARAAHAEEAKRAELDRLYHVLDLAGAVAEEARLMEGWTPRFGVAQLRLSTALAAHSDLPATRLLAVADPEDAFDQFMLAQSELETEIERKLRAREAQT